MTTRDRLHALIDALPDADTATAARVLEALAGSARRDQRGADGCGVPDRVLSIADACALLGIARSNLYRDPVWPTLVDRPSAGRVGLRLSVLLAELTGDTSRALRPRHARRVHPPREPPRSRARRPRARTCGGVARGTSSDVTRSPEWHPGSRQRNAPPTPYVHAFITALDRRTDG